MLKLLTEQKRSWIQQQLDCWSEMVLGRQLACSFIAIRHQPPPFLVHRSYSGDYWLPQALSTGHTLTIFLDPGAKIYDNAVDITYPNSVRLPSWEVFYLCDLPKPSLSVNKSSWELEREEDAPFPPLLHLVAMGHLCLVAVTRGSHYAATSEQKQAFSTYLEIVLTVCVAITSRSVAFSLLNRQPVATYQ